MPDNVAANNRLGWKECAHACVEAMTQQTESKQSIEGTHKCKTRSTRTATKVRQPKRLACRSMITQLVTQFTPV